MLVAMAYVVPTFARHDLLYSIQHQAVRQGNKATVKQLDDCESDSELVASEDPRRSIRTLL